MQLTKVHIRLITLLIISLLWGNVYVIDSTLLGSGITLSYLLFFGYCVGTALLPERSPFEKTFLGILTLIAMLLTATSILYFLASATHPLPLILLTIIPLPFVHAHASFSITKLSFRWSSVDTRSLALSALYLTGYAILIVKIVNSATIEPVRGPWELLHTKFILSYALLTFVWLFFLTQSKSNGLSIIINILHAFLSVSLAVLLFPLGFGYDPFLHRAAEDIILQQGAIEPKTIYYAGHYMLVILGHYLSLIPIKTIDIWLVPLSYSLFVPTMAYVALRHYTKQLPASVFVAPLLMLMPLSQFVISTPQGLAYTFFILTILWWLVYAERPTQTHLGIAILLILATLAIHPIVGIPLLVWLLVLIFDEYLIAYTNLKNKRLLLTLAIPIASLALPAVFLLNNLIGSTLTTRLTLPSIAMLGFTNLWRIETTQFSPQFNQLFDLLYLYRYNWTLLILIVLMCGLRVLIKKGYPRLRDFIIGFAITWFSSILLTLFFTFSELIAYEQVDFANRVFLAALYFIIPVILLSGIELYKRLSSSRYSQFVAAVVLTVIITSVFFISYPRYDRYETIRNFTTSAHDIEAVRRVDELANGQDYIVLANQSVSAAAIQEFGFKAYYNDHFFYPVPTGGPLYEHYLSMVYDTPSKENAQKAATLTGVNTIYFLLNDYWFEAETIRAQAISLADSYEEIHNGAVVIFTYRFAD